MCLRRVQCVMSSPVDDRHAGETRAAPELAPTPIAHGLVGWRSQRDTALVEHAAGVASQNHARLTVLLVYHKPRFRLFAWPNAEAIRLIENASTQAVTELITDFRRVVQRLPDDLSVTTIVRMGPFVPTLVDTAVECRCCSIITDEQLGTRRYSRIVRRMRRNRDERLRLISCRTHAPEAQVRGMRASLIS